MSGEHKITDTERLKSILDAIDDVDESRKDSPLLWTQWKEASLKTLNRLRNEYRAHLEGMSGECKLCGHSLDGNAHGFDQNDADIDDDGNLVHSGRCTYCKKCREESKE